MLPPPCLKITVYSHIALMCFVSIDLHLIVPVNTVRRWPVLDRIGSCIVLHPLIWRHILVILGLHLQTVQRLIARPSFPRIGPGPVSSAQHHPLKHFARGSIVPITLLIQVSLLLLLLLPLLHVSPGGRSRSRPAHELRPVLMRRTRGIVRMRQMW